jgi:5-methylcytosine-specific restriction enzyme subunit McrC
VTRRTVRLVERRPREVRLPPDDVHALLSHARHLIDVVPAFRPGAYWLTPRGHVGCFDTPTLRFAIRPKVPWPTVRMLLGLSHAHEPGAPGSAPDGGFLNMLARELAERLWAVAGVGLVAGYHDQDTAGAFLRGKLRPADHLRDAAARAFPDRFHVTESVLDLDTAWNRIPRALAEQLLDSPGVAADARADLRDAITPLESVPLVTPADADFAAAGAEPRAAHYRPLLALCRLLHDGFAAARLPGAGAGAFLIDLSRAFERFLTESLAAALSGHPGWLVEPQARFPVGATLLQSDILIREGGAPLVVLDAKWKTPGAAPDAADLHQVLAYATLTGTKRVGLVYPGRRFARRELPVAGGAVRVTLYRVRVVGTDHECARSVARLAAVVRRDSAGGCDPAGLAGGAGSE